MTDNKSNGSQDKLFFYIMTGALGLCILIIMIVILARGGPHKKNTPIEKNTAEEALGKISANNRLDSLSGPKQKTIKKITKLLETEDFAKAKKIIDRSLRNFPDNPELLALREKHTVLTKDEKAEQDKFRAFYDSASRAVENGQWGLAVSNLEQAIEIKSSAELEAELERARWNFFKQKAEKAIEQSEYEKALKAIRNAKNIKKDKSLQKAETKVLDALTAKEQIKKNKEKYSEFLSKAEQAFNNEHFKQAISYFTLALEYTLKSGDKSYINGRIRASQKLLARKISIEKSQKLYEKALAFEQEGKIGGAVKLLKKALDLQPDNKKASEHLKKLAKKNLKKKITDKTGASMALIPAGEFIRGGPSDDSTPAKSVCISTFYIDVCEVTNSQFEQFAPEHERAPESAEDNMPVTNVSWHEAMEYCTWRSNMTGHQYRLPTEAEWEKAAKSAKNLAFSWGDEFNPDKGCTGATHDNAVPVRAYQPNEFGLYNMSGNVWEWCFDWYKEDYYKNSPLNDPKGPEKGKFKVVRGGSFKHKKQSFRTFSRNAEDPFQKRSHIGFRAVRVVAAKGNREK